MCAFILILIGSNNEEDNDDELPSDLEWTKDDDINSGLY